LQVAGFSYKEIAARRGWTYTKTNRCITEGRAALQASANASLVSRISAKLPIKV
jgi:DNA-directed RNA polymerase specialized sigma24 family protein